MENKHNFFAYPRKMPNHFGKIICGEYQAKFPGIFASKMFGESVEYCLVYPWIFGDFSVELFSAEIFSNLHGDLSELFGNCTAGTIKLCFLEFRVAFFTIARKVPMTVDS